MQNIIYNLYVHCRWYRIAISWLGDNPRALHELKLVDYLHVQADEPLYKHKMVIFSLKRSPCLENITEQTCDNLIVHLEIEISVSCNIPPLPTLA